MNYTWLFFDADDTLFDYGLSEVQALRATFAPYGVDLNNEHLDTYQVINARLWKQFEKGMVSSERLRVQRFEEFLDSTHLTGDPAEISAAYLEHLSRATDLLPGAVETLTALAPHYHLALITNGLTSVQRPRLAASRIAAFFRVVIISEEIGMAKPSPLYFQYAMQLTGLSQPQQALVIGDSLSSDIRGANQAGIDACWYNPAGLPLPPGLTARYQVRRLTDLLSILIP